MDRRGREGKFGSLSEGRDGGGGLIESEAKSASVGLKVNKIHHHILAEHASTKDRFKHKFRVNGQQAYSLLSMPGMSSDPAYRRIAFQALTLGLPPQAASMWRLPVQDCDNICRE